ncbi:MAG TPA: S41 family peptidase [Candidatus Binatia bacterium]|jgi:tricorn protease|nr:S41 family peptidase [Candidatus Binatia bacterium]
MKRLLFLLALAVPIGPLAAAPASPTHTHLLRHPAYSKGKVAFSYLGDLWLANEDGSGLQRLTDHKAREILPRFSPDGKWLAFSSDREGNYDVYVMPVQGGKPRQLTFHSADDMVVGWAADSQRVLFSSSRGKGAFPSVTTLWTISAEGGMEHPLHTDWGSWGSYSPDGSKLAFTRHPGVWSRKHYRGSYAVDLWLLDGPSKKFTKLGDPDYKGNYLWPMYGRDGDIYFVADRLAEEKNVQYCGPDVMKSVNNIWKISEKGGKPIQVTHHTSGNLFFPSISADGKTIVYEENFGFWKLDLASGKSTEIHLDIKSDSKDNDVELRTVQGEAESFHLSPSSKRAAISTHGEIFTIATDRGEVQRVTETFWREQSPRWSPDGKWIAFVSDRTGREEVWIADERGRHLKQLSDLDCDKSSLTWAPDSKSLLWAGSDHKLRQVEIETAKTEELVGSDIGPITTPQFSPDSKWISYSKQDAILRSHVYVKPLSGGEEHLIEAEDFLLSSGAKWTPDGKKLLLLGGLGAPGMSSLNRTVMQLYSVPLTHLDKNPDDRDVDTEEQAQAAEATPRRSGARAEAAPAAKTGTGDEDTDSPRRARNPGTETATSGKVEVKIEWDGLERRMRKLTSLGGSVMSVAPAPDSRTYAFVAMGGGEEGSRGGAGGGPALYTISESGTNLLRVAQGAPPEPSDETPRGRGGFGGGFGEPQWSKDGRSIYYLQAGGIYAVAISGGSAGDSGTGSAAGGFAGRSRSRGAAPSAAPSDSSSTPRRINFTVRLEVDQIAERRQVFEEAWRVMKNRFYDPKMHGVDWAAAKETYEPLLGDIADSEELHNVIMEMIGELNASHTGISGGGNTDSTRERVQTRHPGFDLEPDASGYYTVSQILKKGPADHDYVKLAPGNFILAVNGKELKTSDNYWRFFNLVPGRKFEFTVNSKPQLDGSWSVSLEPLSSRALADLEYERWVDDHKKMVEKLCDGAIGYLHIRAMDAPSFEKFQRDLLENLGKKALIIDERFNGGGGIDQELLEILNQRVKYQSWRGRGSVEVPRPVQAFFGPMVVLQNERSASNAEMFPEGFRALGLGKLIGVPTMGAVIGTGAYRLLDGSSLRTPGVGVFTAKGDSLENYGVQPDVLVDNTPEDFLSGHDRQIEKAVEVLRAEMK